MSETGESEVSSSFELDPEPQEKFWVLSKLPFDVTIQKEQMLSVIKKTLCGSAQRFSFGLQIKAATEKLYSYLQLFGCHFSKADHINFLKLYFELFLSLDAGGSTASNDYELIYHVWKKLTRKLRLIEPGELVLDWRRVVDRWIEIRTELWSRTIVDGFDHDFGRRFLILASQWRTYFDPNATPEILKAIRAFKYPGFDGLSNHYRVLYGDSIPLLPCLVREGTFSQTVGLWVEDAIDEFLQIDDDIHMSLLLNQLGSVARCNCGFVDFDRALPKMMSVLLSAWRVPLTMFECDRNFVVPQEFSPTSQIFSDVVPLIVHSITPTSKTLDYLEKVIPALTFICDPSVLKSNDRAVKDFFKSFLQCLKNRLRRERFRGARMAAWSEPTPDHALLTDALLERILKLLTPPLETMLFGKFFVTQVADFLGQMALMRPGLMLPRLQTQLDGEFDRMCEAHRVLCALRLANHMLMPSLGLGLATEEDKRAFRPWAIDMLPKMLKFISINNDGTTELAVRFVTCFTKYVPMRACRHAKAAKDPLCAKTAALEEFVVAFTETTLEYYSESSNSEGGGRPSYSWKLLLQFFNSLGQQVRFTRREVWHRIADLLMRRLTSGQFNWWSCDHWEVFCLVRSVVCDQEAVLYLPQLIRYARKLFQEMEEDFDCAGADTYPKDIPQRVYIEIFTVVSLINKVSPVDAREHQQTIRGLLLRCLKFRSIGVSKTLPRVISGFIHTYSGRFISRSFHDEHHEDECQLQFWGMEVRTNEWTPQFRPSPEAEDIAFRDAVVAAIVLPACATLRSLTSASASRLSADDRLELRLALLQLSAVIQGLATSFFSCAPLNTQMGRHPDVPEEISGERYFSFDWLQPVLVEGENLWDLLMSTVLSISECRVNDVKFVDALCTISSNLIGGCLAPLSRGNHQNILTGRRNVYNYCTRNTGPAASYLPPGTRFVDNAYCVLGLFIGYMNSMHFFGSALNPKQWLLLQRLSCVHLPAKDNGLLLNFTYSLLSALTSFPGTSELLVQPVVNHLQSLSDQELELHPLLPFVRLLSLIPWMESLGSWTQLISAVFAMLQRLDKVEMSDLEEWQHRFGLTYKGMSMNWRGPTPEVSQLCAELCPESAVEPPVVQELIDRHLNDVKSWLDLMATFINLRVKDQLLEKFLDFILALYNHNTLGHAKMTEGCAQEILKLLRDSLNPTIKSLCIRVLESVDYAENSGLHLARRIELPGSRVPLLCAVPSGEVPDPLDPPAIRLATPTSLPQIVYVWDSRPAPSAAGLALASFATAPNLLALIDSQLQVLRTNGADSGFDLCSVIGAFAVFASFLGRALLLPELKERLICLAGSAVEEELHYTVTFIRALLLASWRWSSQDLAALWPFLLPILDAFIDTGRASPSNFDFLCSHPIDDPRRLVPLWDHLLRGLESGPADLCHPSTELRATVLLHLLKCCSAWRVCAVRRRLDAFMQPLVARTVPSPRSSRLIERWLKLSVLDPAEAGLVRGPGDAELDLDQPVRWLRQLVARPEAEEAEEGGMPERLRRLYYLCPINVESMRQPRAFFGILADNLKEVLLARGRNFTLNDEASNFASQKIAALTIAVVARVGNLREVERLFQAADEVLLSLDSPPRSLCFALSLERQILCRNAAVVPPKMAARALEHCGRHLASDQQPVVRAAEQALAELLCRGVLTTEAVLAWLGSGQAPPACVAVHALGAILEAFPHCLAPETAKVVAKLDAQLALDRSQRPFVEKVIRNFLRAHQDAWEEKWKAQLPESTLDRLLRLSGSGSYFS